MVSVWYLNTKRRMLYILIASVAFIISYYIGSISPLNQEDANDIKKQFEEFAKDIDSIGIFLNNFRIASSMFIPAFGIAVGLFSAYMTGTVFKAFALTNPELSNIPSLLVLVTPFAIMEIFSYGLAMSQSWILLKALISRSFNKRLAYSTIIQFSMVALILFIAAIIEYVMIEAARNNIMV